MNILVSTFNTWILVPETVGLFNYSRLDLYKNHLHNVETFRKKLLSIGVDCIDEIWLLGTGNVSDEKNKESLRKVNEWNSKGPFVKKICFCKLAGVDDIKNQNAADEFHNMTFEVVATARKKTQATGGKLVLSLAGGRKTMSSDMQDAAYAIGFDALIHVLGERLDNEEGVLLGGVLGMGKGEASVTPVLMASQNSGNEILNEIFADVDLSKELQSGEYAYSVRKDYLKLVRERLNDSRCFYSSAYEDNDSLEMFPAMHTVSRSMKTALKQLKVGCNFSRKNEELKLLSSLPKTELHCHLGGSLGIEEMLEVAETLTDDICELVERNALFADWYSSIDVETFVNPCKACNDLKEKWKAWKNWKKDVAKRCNIENDNLVVPAFLLKFKGKEDLLGKLIYGEYLDEEKFCATSRIGNVKEADLSEYESLGDLQGSALLRNLKAVKKCTEILLRNAKRENVRYLEIRCSPQNYATGSLSAEEIVESILQVLESNKDVRCSLVFIISRHRDPEEAQKCFDLVKSLRENSRISGRFLKYFRGFDLAGNEKEGSLEDFRSMFMNGAFVDCPNITIHAGETMPVDSVWKAVYSLNAERIGHGLTLQNDEHLLNKFLERRIGVEMCPSSNFQTMGYVDNYFKNTECKGALLGKYPLKDYLKKGLRVCVNTDDPGISRTNITNEFLKAGRLTQEGLSLWDVLLLVYNGFSLAFYPYEQKREMLKDINKEIYEWIKEHSGEILQMAGDLAL